MARRARQQAPQTWPRCGAVQAIRQVGVSLGAWVFFARSDLILCLRVDHALQGCSSSVSVESTRSCAASQASIDSMGAPDIFI
jgi:lipid-binding SYLF domain-containing protein